MRFKHLCVLLLLFVLPFVAHADGNSPYTGILYGDGANTRQVLDVFLPAASDGPAPVMFIAHGGGYVFGDKVFVRPAVDFFVEQGFAVVTPNYRLAPSYPYPAPLQDIFCAYAWMLSHAEEYGFDLERVTIVGEFAGANAVAMLATVDDPTFYLEGCAHTIPDSVSPKAAVMYYAPIELSTCACRAAKQMAALYLGLESYEETQEGNVRQQSLQASPLPWLDGQEPPFLLFHGTADTLIPASESELFAHEVTKNGGDAQLIIVEDALHGFFARPAYPYTRESWGQMLEFLAAHGAGME